MSWVIKLLVAVGALYSLVLIALYVGQRHLMYVPDTLRAEPSELGLRATREQELTTPDGETLIAWRLEAAAGQPTILYFHGNEGNLADRVERVQAYQDNGYGLLMLSYRGFGGSSGRPSEAKLYADAALSYDTLRNEGVAARDIIAYGESLGTGVAVQLATQREVGAVILDAAYTSVVDVAQREYPFVWVKPFLSEHYNSASRISKINAPLLILHGERDPLIPPDMARALLAKATGTKRLALFPEGHHSDLYEHGAMEEINRFLADVREDGDAA